jgi:outer membrane protein TolC
MNVRFWTFRNRAMDIRLAVTAAFLAALLVIPPRNCRAEDPPIFNLLPPPTVNSKAPQEAIPAVAEDQHSTSDMPPAFVPTKRAPLLPPPFVPEEAVSPAVPQLANLPDAEQVLTSSTASSPFDAPTLAIDESTVIIGPDKLPPLDDTNYSGFPTNHQGWDPGAPPITSMDTTLDSTSDGPFAAQDDVDREFYQSLLQHPPMDDAATPTIDAIPVERESANELWWTGYTSKPMRNAVAARPVSINSLIESALKYSAQIQVISDTPLIRETAIIESDAAFDWSGFMETTWYDTNEPVGSTLTTGGPPRFENKLFEYEYGLRKQTSRGGRLEIGQRYGHENSNSIFFIPNDQGTARLTLNYTQPLLRGAGRVYNTSLVLLAQVEAGAARNEFSRELQEHLLEVTRGYWALYLERGALIQKQRLFKRGQEILAELEHRESIDAVANQIVRARAAVAARESDLFRSAAAVKNAEGRIRALVNDPQLGMLDEFELMPIGHPTNCEVPVDMRQSMEASFRHRPEIHSAIKQIKASSVRQKMSKNELLPALDMVLETYVAGLRGESDLAGAWRDMFQEGEPSYSAGLQLDIPLRNREAKARFQRRAIETRQFQNQFRATLHAMQLEVEIAVREVQTSHREMEAKLQAMKAAASEVEYIDRRWRLLPGEDRTASLVLEDLLGAQERLTAEEFDYLNAQVTYNLAITNLHKATGTLLHMENITTTRTEDCGIPQTRLHKAGGRMMVDPQVGPAAFQAPMP